MTNVQKELLKQLARHSMDASETFTTRAYDANVMDADVRLFARVFRDLGNQLDEILKD